VIEDGHFTSNGKLAPTQEHRIAWRFIAAGKADANGICEAFNECATNRSMRRSISTRLEVPWLGAGPSSATLVDLHIV
jgi:hypothetical protein